MYVVLQQKAQDVQCDCEGDNVQKKREEHFGEHILHTHLGMHEYVWKGAKAIVMNKNMQNFLG